MKRRYKFSQILLGVFLTIFIISPFFSIYFNKSSNKFTSPNLFDERAWNDTYKVSSFFNLCFFTFQKY